MIEISLICPVYNEEEILEKNTEQLLAYLENHPSMHSVRFEIILGINGSTDKSELIGKKLSEKYSNIKYVVTKKKGFGAGIRAGIEVSRGKFISFFPIDLDLDLKFITKALELRNSYDFIMGSKYEHKGKTGVNSTRFLFSLGFHALFRIFYGNLVKDVGNLKFFKGNWARTINPHFKENGFAWQLEILSLALASNFTIIEIPNYLINYSKPRSSKVNIIKDALDLFYGLILYGLIGTRMRQSIKRIKKLFH